MPRYAAIAPPPCSFLIRLSRSMMSPIASSQVTRVNVPSGCRLSGWVTRSGSFWTSAYAMPFWQA